MRHDWDREEKRIEALAGCGGILVILLIAAAIWFIQPLIIVKAWTMFAVGMFGLPTLNYWTAFWVNWAVGCLFGGSFSNIALRDKK